MITGDIAGAVCISAGSESDETSAPSVIRTARKAGSNAMASFTGEGSDPAVTYYNNLPSAVQTAIAAAWQQA